MKGKVATPRFNMDAALADAETRASSDEERAELQADREAWAVMSAAERVFRLLVSRLYRGPGRPIVGDLHRKIIVTTVALGYGQFGWVIVVEGSPPKGAILVIPNGLVALPLRKSSKAIADMGSEVAQLAGGFRDAAVHFVDGEAHTLLSPKMRTWQSRGPWQRAQRDREVVVGFLSEWLVGNAVDGAETDDIAPTDEVTPATARIRGMRAVRAPTTQPGRPSREP